MDDYYVLTYFNTSKNKHSKKDFKKEANKANIFIKELAHSNSETDFIKKKVKEKRKIILRYLRKKNKILSTNQTLNTYQKGSTFRKMIKKNKLELSQCIEKKGDKDIKLFGNPRYKNNPPYLFVQDVKKKISDEKIGLIPMPMTNRDENNLYKQPNYIFSIQRNLSMTRRFQYNKKEELLKSQKDYLNYNKKNNYFNTVQLWWKKLPLIIKIQKNIKGYLIRRKIKPIFHLFKFIQYFEQFLINLKLKKVLMYIFFNSAFKIRIKTNGFFISKENKVLSKDIIENIIMIQNKFRCYLSVKKKNFLLRSKRGFIINKSSFISKQIYIGQNKINNNIVMIQNHIKDLVERKNYFDKNLVHKSSGIYYYEKIYLSYKNQKIIKFVKLIRHILQILAFKKKIFYKNPCDYDLDDINKVKFIQKNYVYHYYNNIKRISLPSIKKNIFSNSDVKLDSNITKERIKNVINKFLSLQKMIRWFIIKRMSIKNQINKKYININYFITKEQFKLNNCISKICHFQKIYKSQYKKNKNNIINYEEPSMEDSSYDDFTDRENKTLRQLTYKNRIPKKVSLGLYISKERKIYNDQNINNLNNKALQHQEGILITKKRYYNNEKKIKKIQKIIKKRKMPKYYLQRPLTNNYNFFTNNYDSYTDDILLTKKK